MNSDHIIEERHVNISESRH